MMSEEVMEFANTAAENIMELTKENEKLKEENEKLNSHGQEQHDHYENEILDLKKQIPDKKGKKLSQKDKEILQDVWRDVAAIYAPATPEGTEEYEELHHKLKLIHRLMK